LGAGGKEGERAICPTTLSPANLDGEGKETRSVIPCHFYLLRGEKKKKKERGNQMPKGEANQGKGGEGGVRFVFVLNWFQQRG